MGNQTTFKIRAKNRALRIYSKEIQRVTEKRTLKQKRYKWKRREMDATENHTSSKF